MQQCVPQQSPQPSQRRQQRLLLLPLTAPSPAWLPLPLPLFAPLDVLLQWLRLQGHTKKEDLLLAMTPPSAPSAKNALLNMYIHPQYIALLSKRCNNAIPTLNETIFQFEK